MRGRSGIAAAVVLVLAAVALLLAAAGSGLIAVGRDRWQHASCPAQVCPACGGSDSSGGGCHGLQAGQQAGPGASGSSSSRGDKEGAGSSALLCGGAAAVPSPDASVAAARAALLRGPADDFAEWEERGGFTLEDLQAAAVQLGAEGTHDLRLWVEVRATGRRGGLPSGSRSSSSVLPPLRCCRAAPAAAAAAAPPGCCAQVHAIHAPLPPMPSSCPLSLPCDATPLPACPPARPLPWQPPRSVCVSAAVPRGACELPAAPVGRLHRLQLHGGDPSGGPAARR